MKVNVFIYALHFAFIKTNAMNKIAIERETATINASLVFILVVKIIIKWHLVLLYTKCAHLFIYYYFMFE